MNSLGRSTLPLLLLVYFSAAVGKAENGFRGPLSPSTAHYTFEPFCSWKFLRADNLTKRKHHSDLGHLVELDTAFKALDPEEMHTRFDLINSRKTTRGIKFDPSTSVSLGGPHKTLGPYEYDLDLLLESSFDLSQRTIIMIPGYRSHEEDDWIKEAREYWLELLPAANVIQVSWTDSNRVIYERAVANTVIIARQVIILLHYLAELSGSSLEDREFLSRIHIIGHSLGAHIAGFVGQDLGGRLGRITGLDPAGPSFDNFGPNQRLDPTDAQLVDVIHTNRGTMKYMNFILTAPIEGLNRLPLVSNLGKVLGQAYNGEADTSWFGIDMNIGHLDYNANNGRVQPGCEGLFHICDHRRAKEIYNDLLRHELELRRLVATHLGDLELAESQQMLKASRFFVYKADTFENFANGRSLAKLVNFSGERHHSSEAQFNMTSLPLDLVTPVGELIDELELYRGIKIRSAQTVVPVSYYFKTSHESANIGDHWIIKLLVIPQESRWDDKKCVLSANMDLVSSKDVKSVSIDVLKVQDTLAGGNFIGLPFIHPDDPVSRIQMLKLTKMVERHEHLAEARREFFEKTLQHLLPASLTLSIDRPKTENFVGAVRDAALKYIKYDAQDLNCELAISSVELQLVGEKTINAIYNLDHFGKKNDFFVMNSKDYHEMRLAEESKSPKGRLTSLFSLNAQNSLNPSLSGVYILT